jgi:hypothetical protein
MYNKLLHNSGIIKDPWDPIDEEDNRLMILKNCVKHLYNMYCKPEDRLFLYTIANGEWNPITRKPRIFKNVEHLDSIMDYIGTFMNNEGKYKNEGYSYRLGILVRGPSGTRKSTIPEMVSMNYDMPIYMVNINDGKHITPASLIKLVSQVPERSIIVFDEIDKQLKEHHNTMGIYSGILSAIDGPQRLSYGSIVIFTTNSSLDPKLTENLIRPGRVDKEFVL